MLRLISIVALCAFLTYPYQNEAARILVVVPTPSISHQVVFRPLTQELARRVNDVIVITTDPAFPKGQTPKNLTEIDLHDLSYEKFKKTVLDVAIIKHGEKNGIIKQYKHFVKPYVDIFEEQTKILEVRNIIVNKNNTFDLLIVEALARFALGFSYAINAPVIAVSSFGGFIDNYDVIGAPSHPLLYPVIVNTRLYNLSLWEIITQYYNFFTIMLWYMQKEDYENAAVTRIFGVNTPSIRKMQNNVDMLFLNIHPIWEDNRPVPPAVVYMGGLHQNPQKELPKDLKSFLDSSVNGVIYLSFGTNVDPTVLPPEKIQTIIKAFSQLPYDILWKWNNDILPGRTKNIKISKWFPQSDLLRHPKIKLFITQGGLQSTEEALTAGVPLIGIPMILDQWYNVEKYVHHKIGIQLEFQDLEVESLKSAIETVIDDKSYRENIMRMRTLMEDQPMPPLQRAVWWTEHVLRHGGARHLRAPAANMPWTQYYEIELVLTVLGAAIALIVSCLLAICLVVKIVRRLLLNVKVKKCIYLLSFFLLLGSVNINSTYACASE